MLMQLYILLCVLEDVLVRHIACILLLQPCIGTKAYRSLMIARIPPIHVFIVNAAVYTACRANLNIYLYNMSYKQYRCYKDS